MCGSRVWSASGLALALRLAYNGSGIAQLKLEKFVVWFILCAICLALANANQFILGRNGTSCTC